MSCSDDLTTTDLATGNLHHTVMERISAGSERDENLWGVIDHANVTGINITSHESAAQVLKTWDNRHDMEVYVESGVDDQMILHIPFIHSTRLRSLLLLPPSPSSSDRPTLIKVFVNLPSAPSFDDCLEMKAVQEIMCGVPGVPSGGGGAGWIGGEGDGVRGEGGRREVEEWGLKVQKMSSVWSVTLMISDSVGGDKSRLYYVGFKGESRQPRRGETTETVVPAANGAEAPIKPLQESAGAASRVVR